MYSVFRDNIHVPFAKVGFMALFVAYIAFLVHNILTPAYYIDAFFTNPSAFIALKFLTVYLVVASVVILLIAAALYAYIEVGRYKQQVAYLTEKRTLLEVRVPENLQETLASMEAVFEMISYGSGEGLWFPVWWEGRKRPLYSFEIVSKGGVVSFIISTREFFVDSVRSAIFAFYPKAQVLEVDEYVYDFEYDEETHSIFPFEWKFSRNNALPIKSYIEFQLEKRNSPGAMSGTNLPAAAPSPLVDPLAPLYDLFGTIRGDEQLWIQYVFRTQKYPRPVEGVADDPTERAYWKKQKLPQEINEALVALEKKVIEGKSNDEPVVLSESEKRLREVGPRLQEKQALDVGIRMVYIASKESFTPARIAPMASVYKLTGTGDNSLVPHGAVLYEEYQIPALESKNTKLIQELEKKLLLQLYRDRMFWYAPALYSHYPGAKKPHKAIEGSWNKRVATVMTTETLATICHFPTPHIKTPSVQRVLSTSVEPPENLPV